MKEEGREKRKKKTFVERAYTTRRGRLLLNLMFYSGALKAAGLWVRSPFSRGMTKRFIKKNDIDMTPYGKREYKSFAEFFIRKKEYAFDGAGDHLISPCDACLSVYGIGKDSVFTVKGRGYTVNELLEEEETARRFEGGLCLIYRLRETDYHRFCYIDDGFQGKKRFIKGKLHSVQPIALEREPVYRVNRRLWTTFESAHFGFVAQCAVGAVLVGGIVYEKENDRVKKGEEMGRFELRGSTIVQFFEKGAVELLPEILELCLDEREVEVKIGQRVGTAGEKK